MKYIIIILVLTSVCYAHNEDIFPDQAAIVKRVEYSNNLEINLKKSFRQASVSLFGLELEHILILSPFCSAIKNYLLTDARQIGIMSATCRWYNGQFRLRTTNGKPSHH